MNEPKHDPLAGRFDRYRAEMTTAVTPPGPSAVRRTVRGRRRLTVGAASAAALALVGAPVAGYAALSGGPAPVPPSPTPSASASPEPQVSPSASASPSGTRPAAAGPITKTDLLRAALDLPSWREDAPCPEDDVRLTDTARNDGDNWLVAVVNGDVNADGDQEAIATITCVYRQTGQTQVVVFDRDATGIVTVGRVVATDQIVDVFSPTKIGWIAAVQPGSSGQIRVQVGDVQPCCGWPDRWTQRQWRTYAWRGNAFRQIAGPTVFGASKYFVDLRVGATDMTFRQGAGGTWRGTVTVTVRNNGPYRPEHARLALNFPGARVEPTGNGWAACQDVPQKSDPTICILREPFRPEEERTLVLELTAAVKPSVSGMATAEVDRYDANGFVPDPTPTDNRAAFTVS